MTNKNDTVTLTLTRNEVSDLKRMLIREERMLESLLTNSHAVEEAAELTALRQKIHDQI